MQWEWSWRADHDTANVRWCISANCWPRGMGSSATGLGSVFVNFLVPQLPWLPSSRFNAPCRCHRHARRTLPITEEEEESPFSVHQMQISPLH